jgi:two-component system sensor histidine kinase QseC
VNDAAHELRTPLAVIGAQAHVLSRSTDPKEREEAAQHLTHAIARGSHLIQQLLELATMDGSTHPEMQRIDVAELTRRHLAQASKDAANRQLELILESPDSVRFSLPVPLYESVLRNLLDNAVKYVDEGGHVIVTLRLEEGVLMLSVVDSGPGIPLEEHALVFDRFHRVAGSSAHGTGLGLAIARQACQRMGGSIELAQNPTGRGVRSRSAYAAGSRSIRCVECSAQIIFTRPVDGGVKTIYSPTHSRSRPHKIQSAPRHRNTDRHQEPS